MCDNLKTNQLKLCKYQEYLNTNIKNQDQTCKIQTNADLKNKQIQDLTNSGLINVQTFYKNKITPKNQKTLEEDYHVQPILTKNLLMKNYGSHKKFENVKLQKVSPKNINIKFKEQFHHSLKKKHNKNNISKINKVLAHYRIMELVQNKILIDNQNKLKDQNKQNQQNNFRFDTLFNVRSIKMIKKISEIGQLKNNQIPFFLNRVNSVTQKNNSTHNSKKNKYQKLFKKQSELSNELQKSFPKVQKDNINIKLTYHDLKRITEMETNQKIHLYKQKKVKKSFISEVSTKNIENIDQFKTISTEQNKLHTTSTYQKRNSNNQINLKFPTTQQKQNIPMTSSLKAYDKIMICKPDHHFQEKLMRYRIMLMKNAQLHKLQLTFVQNYSRNQFNYYVGKGNNSVLVKQVLKKRWWLGHCQDKKNLQRNNIIWTQLKDKAYYEIQPVKPNQIQNLEDKKTQINQSKNILHNHFQQNQFLGNKKALFYNMKSYYSSKGINVFDYLPLTYHIINYDDNSWKQFVECFNKFSQQDPNMRNIWILKPGQNSNRGNGITVHSNLSTIQSAIKSEQSNRTYILQKYIEKPFLYNKRKFDIRCYMLLVRINQKIKGYWYQQGYIRTSGYQFSLNDCQNTFIHLTNDAIQVNCDNYGKYQDGNKLNYETFQKYLDQNFNNSNNNNANGQKKYDIQRDIIPKLKNICLDSICACYSRLGKWKQNIQTFQLFGLDFMIDQQFNPWLIQINTNPCLQTSSRVLEKIIPSLLDNVYKLSVDIVFPPPLNWSNNTKYSLSKNIDKNLFQLIFDEEQIQKSSPNKLEELMKQLPIDKIGEIDQDNEIYEEQE